MAINLPPKDTPGVHVICDNLSCEWLQQGHVFSFTWGSISRPTVDAYNEAYQVMIRNWSSEERFNELENLYFDDFAFTPYLRSVVQQNVELAKKLGLTGRVALLMKPNMTMRVIQFFLTSPVVRSVSSIQTRVFSDRKKALDWLSAS